MVKQDIPIQMIAHWAADGQMQPLRFRFEDPTQRVHTVQIDKVVDVREIEHIGVEALIFLCRATEGDWQRLYELKYTLRTHKWVLFREMY